MFRLFSPIRTLLGHRPDIPLQEDVLRLSAILGIAPQELSSVRLGRRYHYRPSSVPKRDGRERVILAPSPALKALQRRLLRRYLVAQRGAHKSAPPAPLLVRRSRFPHPPRVRRAGAARQEQLLGLALPRPCASQRNRKLRKS